MDYTRVKHQSAAGNLAFIIKSPKGATVLLSKDGSDYASFRETLMVRETTNYVGSKKVSYKDRSTSFTGSDSATFLKKTCDLSAPHLRAVLLSRKEILRKTTRQSGLKTGTLHRYIAQDLFSS